MKKIIRWLEENEIEYSVSKYGNANYFKDNFSVEGIQIAFYFDGIGNIWDKQKALTDYMCRKKSYACTKSAFGAGYTYRIMKAFDSWKLAEHEARIEEAAERYWKEEHAQKMAVSAMIKTA